jgi:predicted DNA-binding transcriptional regulator AlpA
MNEWAITVEMATDRALDEDAVVELDELAEEHNGAVSNRGTNIGFLLHTYIAGPPNQAGQFAIELAEKLAAHAGVHADLASLIVETEEQAERRALTPDTPELLAATDVADLLGVSRQRVHQLATDRADFPKPYARLGSGPIWTRPAIEAFDKLWTRKPGRPARKAS